MNIGVALDIGTNSHLRTNLTVPIAQVQEGLLGVN